jgi:hypothetical protein
MGRAVGQTMTAAGIWWGDAERRETPTVARIWNQTPGGP